MTSILNSIKKIRNVPILETFFDQELIMYINSSIVSLTQMGVGPEEGFVITSDKETWEYFIGDSKKLESIKTYIGLKTQLLFDPPSNSSVLDAINKTINEIEWRIVNR